MRHTSIYLLLNTLLLSFHAGAETINAPAAPSQPSASQDGLLAYIEWADQTPNTEAYISQSVNGSAWSEEIYVPFRRYQTQIELGKTYIYRIKACYSDIIVNPPDTTMSVIRPKLNRLANGTNTKPNVLVNTTTLSCSEWSVPSALLTVPALQVKAPSISPKNIEITVQTTVTLTPVEAGVTVRYAINSNIVTQSSPVFPTSLVVDSSQTVTLKSFKSGYANSNSVTFYFTKVANIPVSVSYKYDALGRLIKVEGSNGKSTEYVLDENGNRKSINIQ